MKFFQLSAQLDNSAKLLYIHSIIMLRIDEFKIHLQLFTRAKNQHLRVTVTFKVNL